MKILSLFGDDDDAVAENKNSSCSNSSKEPHDDDRAPRTRSYSVLCTFHSTERRPRMRIQDTSLFALEAGSHVSIKSFPCSYSALEVSTICKPCFRSCSLTIGPETSSMSLTWECIRDTEPQPRSRPTESGSVCQQSQQVTGDSRHTEVGEAPLKTIKMRPLWFLSMALWVELCLSPNPPNSYFGVLSPSTSECVLV